MFSKTFSLAPFRPSQTSAPRANPEVVGLIVHGPLPSCPGELGNGFHTCSKGTHWGLGSHHRGEPVSLQCSTGVPTIPLAAQGDGPQLPRGPLGGATVKSSGPGLTAPSAGPVDLPTSAALFLMCSTPRHVSASADGLLRLFRARLRIRGHSAGKANSVPCTPQFKAALRQLSIPGEQTLLCESPSCTGPASGTEPGPGPSGDGQLWSPLSACPKLAAASGLRSSS